jgi:hypothetical protein
VSEGTGWAAGLRRVMNTRMEEMSFRSGLAVFAAVLALTGIGVALTLTLGGGHPAAAAPRAASAGAAPRSAPPQSSAAALPSPSASPTATQASPESQPVADYTPEPVTTTHAASAPPSSPWPTPRPPKRLRSRGPSQGWTPPPEWWFPGWPGR